MLANLQGIIIRLSRPILGGILVAIGRDGAEKTGFVVLAYYRAVAPPHHPIW